MRLLAAERPSLVLWGDRDPCLAAAFADRFGAREVRHFPQCGHWPQVEMPELIAQELVDFLSR